MFASIVFAIVVRKLLINATDSNPRRVISDRITWIRERAVEIAKYR